MSGTGGVFVIITIPTKVEENNLRNKPKKLQFENGVAVAEATTPSISRTLLSRDTKLKTSTGNHDKWLALTPSITSIEAQTPTNTKISEKCPMSNEAVVVIESATSEQNGVEKKPLLDVEEQTIATIQRTKSSDQIHSTNNSLMPKEDINALRKSWEGFKEVVSSARKIRSAQRKKKEEEPPELIEIQPDSPMEEVLSEILKKLKIDNSTWTKSQNGKSYQVTFAMECDQIYDSLVQKIMEWGIGDREGSTVSILPCTAYYKPQKESSEDGQVNEEELNADKDTAWNKFINSVRARLNVAQIVDEVKQDATVTFDFVILVIVAAILASFGLVEDSTVFLASSMLISPLMGPIIAGTFGTVIKDRKLQHLGVVNELIGIFLATFVGFLFGLIICGVDERYGRGEGLSKEMLARCELHSLMVGILTAIPSGAAVAIAILGENIGSLVGVAISASLLPPAVNAGLLWALGCIYLMFENDDQRYNQLTKTNYYSDHQATELAVLGSISMCITITNIICIFVMGVLLLKIKEVAPIVSRHHRQFWKHDIKIARDYNKTMHAEDGMSFSRKIADDIAEHEGIMDFNADIFKSIAKASYQNTWSPMSARQNFPKLDSQSRPTMEDLERLYMTMARPYDAGNRSLTRASISGPVKAIGRTSWSPPKLKPILDERLQAISRRASMPFEILHPSPKSQHLSSHKIAQLEKIDEINGSVPDDGNTSSNNHNERRSTRADISDHIRSGFSRKTRKFTVTPASDPKMPKKE